MNMDWFGLEAFAHLLIIVGCVVNTALFAAFLYLAWGLKRK